MNTLVVVQLGQSQTAHGGMLYVTTPGCCDTSRCSESPGGEGGYVGLDGETPGGSAINVIVGSAGCFEAEGNVSKAKSTGKHSVKADVT